LNYLGWKIRQQVAADLKRIYQSVIVAEAEQQLAEFEAQWNGEYPSIARSGGATGAASFRFSTTRPRFGGFFTPLMPSNR
jgi:transposase-like protein